MWDWSISTDSSPATVTVNDSSSSEVSPQHETRFVLRRVSSVASSVGEWKTFVMDQKAFNLATTYVHLGLGARARQLPDFEWSAEYLATYEADTASDGPEGRLVMISSSDDSWSSWERHPHGEELVVLLSGRATVIQQINDAEERVDLTAGHALINPAGVWHTADVYEPSTFLFITPGLATEHTPR